MTHELSIPEAAKQDPNSQEIIRVWINDEGQYFALQIGDWEDPAIWGYLLADLATDIAKAYGRETDLDPVDSLMRVWDAFNVELENPTDTAA